MSHCISECTSNADVFFALDASGSVHYDNFNKMKDFVQAVVGNLNVFDEESNVGVITFGYDSYLTLSFHHPGKVWRKNHMSISSQHLFRTKMCLFLHSDEATMQFTLSDYNQRQDYIDAIDRIQYRAGNTNTAAALSMIRNQGKLLAASAKHRGTCDSITISFLKL